MIEDSFGNIWIGTSDRLFCYKPKTNTYIIYQYNSQNLNSLPNNNVSTFY
ncbi:MAG: hypothetical protein IPK14_18035 [Blastocatellia bacterium]|nr:hypothetical protein [Blastocatellia bacterium]